MARITGTDQISLKAIEYLENGMKIKDVAAELSISLDQTKRLSRYQSFLKKAKKHLSVQQLDKVKLLGLKSLYLAPLFQNEDWEGLTEVLSAITETTKRDELPVLIEALEGKRARIQEFQQEIDNKLHSLQKKENEIVKAKADIEKAQQSIQQQVQFLSKYDIEVQEFLADHLGIAKNGELCLAKRLDYRWQKNLKKKGIISFYKPNPFDYNETDRDRAYTYFVKDLDGMVEDLKKRWKRGWDTRWDYEKESKRVENNAFVRWAVPSDPSYRNAEGLATDLRSEIDYCNKRIQEIETERQNIKKEMKQLRKTSPRSFIEQVEASNTLSVHDIKRHGEMVNKALKWLSAQGYIVCSEITLPNGKRADVIGYNENKHIIIIEVKVSRSDFLQDHKWKTYLDYCDTFYFFTDQSITPLIQMKKDYQDIGLLQEKGNSLHVEYPHEAKHVVQQRKSIIFSINKTLSRKYVYGY